MQLQQFLIDFVVEQTGYPPDIVELDADLEADLGIDSIKKAQLFGELREMFGFSGRAEHSNGRAAGEIPGRQSLADYRTLRNVLDSLLQSQPGRQPEGMAIASTQANTTPQANTTAQATTTAQAQVVQVESRRCWRIDCGCQQVFQGRSRIAIGASRLDISERFGSESQLASCYF